MGRSNIQQNGNIIIINSTLNNNKATTKTVKAFSNADAWGGVIYNNNGNLTITNSTLNNNKATATPEDAHLDAKAQGGVIYNNNGNIIITNSTLNNNKATAPTADSFVNADARGGAIYNSGTLTITNSTLQNNKANSTARGTDTSAKAYGGAIYNSEDNYNYNITGTTFYPNTPANFIINETTKKIQLNEEDNYISIGKFSIIVDGKEIANGTSTDDLTNKEYSIPDYGNIVEIIINGTDDKTLNNRYILRGSIEVHNYTELVKAIEKAQSENYDSLLIYLLHGDYNATRSIKWEESETKNLIINGNGLTLDGKYEYQFIRIGSGLNLILVNVTLTNFIADNGGAIENLGHLTIINSSFTKNTANSGGAIYSENILNITGSNFIQNSASSGAAINFNGNTTNLISNVFTQNTASADGETLKLVGSVTVENNIYNSTDIAFKTLNLNVKDHQQYYLLDEKVVLNFTIELEHPESYDEDIPEKLDKTVYINGIANVTTKYNNYTLSNLEFGEYSIIYKLNHNISNTVTFNVMVVSEITTPEKEYDYYEGIKNTVTLEINNPTGEKGTVDISVKDGDKYQKLLTYPNVKDGYTFTTEALKDALENLYDNLDNSYIINITYTSNYLTPSSTEFTLNIIKQRNTSIIYDILNNTEGNVQINITVTDTVSKTAINDANIKITGDITQTATSGIITDTTLTPGSYTINVLYDETDNYKSSEATINFNVEIDKDKKIEELEEQVENLNNTIQEQNNTIKDLNNTIQEQGSTINKLNDTVKDLNSTVQDQVGIISDLNSTVQEQTVTINTLNNTVQVQASTIRDLNSTVQDQVGIISDLNSTVQEQAGTINTLNNTVQEQTSTINTLNDIVNDLNSTVQDQVGTINNLNNTVQDQTTTINNLNNTVHEQGVTIQDLQEQIDELKEAKNTTIILDEIIGAKFDENVTIRGILVNDDSIGLFNQVVTLTIGDEEINVTTKGGVFEYIIVFKELGEKTVTVNYAGNDKYLASEATILFNVGKQDVIVTYNPITDTAYGDNVTITGKFIDVNQKAISNSNVNVYINGKQYKARTDKTGTYSLEAKVTSIGTNNVTVGYGGNAYYNAYESSTNFTGLKQDIIISFEQINDTQYGENVTVIGILADKSDKAISKSNMNVYINGKQYKARTDNNRVFNISVRVTKVGTNNVTVGYVGNEYYNSYESTKTFAALKQDVKITLDSISDVSYGDNVTITGRFTEKNGRAISKSNVNVYINGKQYKARTDSNGKFNISVKTNKLGVNYVTVTYPGNNYYNSFETNTKFNAGKQNVNITVDSIEDVMVGENVTITGRFTEQNGNPISKSNVNVYINGKQYKARTDSTGAFKLSVATKTAGTNNVTCSYGGNAYYYNCETDSTFNVIAKLE